MATAASAPAITPRTLSIKPDRFDRMLAGASLILLAALVTALARGRGDAYRHDLCRGRIDADHAAVEAR